VQEVVDAIIQQTLPKIGVKRSLFSNIVFQTTYFFWKNPTPSGTAVNRGQ